MKSITSMQGEPQFADLSHREVRELLPEYAALALDRRDPEHSYPAVAAHLARCAACERELLELLDMAAIAYSGSAPAATDVTPDLSFLTPAPGIRPTWSALGELVVSFVRALDEATRVPQLTGAFRGQTLHRASVPLGRAGWDDLRVELRAEGALHCALVLWVAPPSANPLDPPLVRGRLRAGAAEVLAVSDESGALVFGGIPRQALGDVQVAISFDDAPPAGAGLR